MDLTTTLFTYYEVTVNDASGDVIITCKFEKQVDAIERDDVIQSLIDEACLHVSRSDGACQRVSIEIMDDIPGERIEDLILMITICMKDNDKRLIEINKHSIDQNINSSTVLSF